MKITIIYDNTAINENLIADWGFSTLIEFKGKRILFDTGAKGSVLLKNMHTLGIDPQSIDEVFISHYHYDHTGGLSTFFDLNNDVTLYIPPSFKGVHNHAKLEYITGLTCLHQDIYSTGELKKIEQSLIFKTENGLVIIVGCAHPKIGNILKAAREVGKPYALIGGFHGFRKFNLLKNMEIICPTHCTRHIKEIKELYPKKYIEGGAGRIIEI
ncbi:MAG: MBL fold metallo-hydrolase [Candidatus Cloacimonadota bacterium]|nr:MBL fold metallo-hydrolase [Candidatus Cloacimonadota bacterium]